MKSLAEPHLISATAESLAEPPVRWGRVVGDHLAAVAGMNSEGERTPDYVIGPPIECPLRPPVAVHLQPLRLGALDIHLLHVASARYVVNEHDKKVGVSVDGEAHPSLLVTRHPASQNTTDGTLCVCGTGSFCFAERNWINLKHSVQRGDLQYLRKLTGMTPPTLLASVVNMGSDRSKCFWGGLHHPPVDPEGQKLVAVTIIFLPL